MDDLINEQVESIKERFCEELAFKILDIEYFTLPYDKILVQCEVYKSDSEINIIEEFIIKSIVRYREFVRNADYIRELLGLDRVFIDVYIENLISKGYLERNTKSYLKVTDKGENIISDLSDIDNKKIINLEVYSNRYLDKFLNTVVELDNIDTFKYIEQLEEERKELTEDKVEDSLLKNSIIKNLDELKEIKNITNFGTVSSLYASIWIYDILGDKLFCKVWSFSEGKYSDTLNKILEENELDLRKKEIDEETENELKQKEKEAISKAGLEGEKRVEYALKWLDKEKYSKLHNVYILGKHDLQEFDHIVIGPLGIVHVETKNKSGVIKIENEHWYNKNKRTNDNYELMENVSEQVDRHHYILKQIFNDSINIHGYIAISNENIKDIIVPQDYKWKVFKYSSIRSMIEKEDGIYEKEEVDEVINILKCFIIDFNKEEVIEFRKLVQLNGSDEIISKYFNYSKENNIPIDKVNLINELRSL